MAWHVRVLDHFEVEGEAGGLAIASRKAVALLSYLLAQRGGAARREVVAGLLWENVDAAQGRTSLRQSLAALKGAGPEGPLVLGERDLVRLGPAVGSDLQRFRALAAGGLDDKRQAAALHRTDLMAGFAVPGAPAFNDWLAGAQAELRRELAAVLLALVEAGLAPGGDLEEAAVSARRLLAAEPYNEVARRALMAVLARQGRSSLAIAQYRDFAALLRQDLQIAPEPATRRLYDDLVNGRRGAPAASAAPPAPEPDDAPPPPPAPAPPERRRARIAVVDDEAGLRDAVATYLRLHDLDVVECDGADALDRAMALAPFDLVILDITMPGRDGLSVLRALQSGPRTRTILVSARTDLVDRVVGLELGAEDYIGKPFELRELLARVRVVLRRAEV